MISTRTKRHHKTFNAAIVAQIDAAISLAPSEADLVSEEKMPAKPFFQFKKVIDRTNGYRQTRYVTTSTRKPNGRFSAKALDDLTFQKDLEAGYAKAGVGKITFTHGTFSLTAWNVRENLELLKTRFEKPLTCAVNPLPRRQQADRKLLTDVVWFFESSGKLPSLSKEQLDDLRLPWLFAYRDTTPEQVDIRDRLRALKLPFITEFDLVGEDRKIAAEYVAPWAVPNSPFSV